jgi:hypothetical protein
MRTALFWTITQRVLVVSYLRFAATYRPHLQESRTNYRPLKIEPKGCPETSVLGCHSMLRNSPDIRRSRLLRGGNLK